MLDEPPALLLTTNDPGSLSERTRIVSRRWLR
jgi:hypothetical protein